MNILQAFKMAWKSIAGKKGRSALTILSIFIGIAAVMTIVSVMEGMKEEMMKQLNAMGSNRLTVYMYSWMYDADGNNISHDYFPDLYDYCQSMKETVVGVTPNGQANATVVYGTKNSANMETKYDEQWNLISGPPTIYFGSDQYSACSNLTLAKGRDLAYLDMQSYNQVCVIGAEAAKIFFGPGCRGEAVHRRGADGGGCGADGARGRGHGPARAADGGRRERRAGDDGERSVRDGEGMDGDL